MFSSRKAPASVDNTALVVNAADAKSNESDDAKFDGDVTNEADNYTRRGCCKSGSGACMKGKCKKHCCCMAFVFLLFSPVIVPLMLVRRAIYGPMKCNRKCKKDSGVEENVACKEEGKEEASKDAVGKGDDEESKMDCA